MSKAQDDDLVMGLTQLVLDQPADQREAYLKDACAGDDELYSQVWKYVEWEDRMQGFLVDPLCGPLPEDEERLEPGVLLEGRFRIVREVAQGGMGIVYEATDEKLRKRIALKCAKTGFGQRLSPEVRHACEISHPNVCRTFEIHTASTAHGEVEFLTMEFLDGETLTARLRRGRLSEAEARAIGMQICQGLAEAHRNRVVHGDLKSNNVILTQSAAGGVRAVITDFGLAHTALDETGESGGTPGYMAPELLQGAQPTAASDVYALGVILHELSTGHRPGRQDKLSSVLARCLDPDPAKRYPDAVYVAHALQPKRRGRWWLAAAASVALAAGVGAVTYERATAPQESIQLAVLPLEASSDVPVAKLNREVSQEMAHLKGGTRARLTVNSSAQGATHTLHGRLVKENGHFVLHALLTETRAQVNSATWDFIYAPDELRFAPQALAGMTTAALRLPPLPLPPINAAAKSDYTSGLAATRQNSTIDQALPLLERAVKVDPDSPLTWAALGEAQWFKYFITKDKAWLERTGESLRQAQRRDLDIAQVHRVNGLLLASSYELAGAEYQRAIELDPGNAQNYWRLGQVYENTNRLDQALAALQKAVQLEPTYFKMYLQLGAFYFKRGDLKQAVEQLENCVRLAPSEPEAHYALGTAYSDLGRWDQADPEFRAATVPGGPQSAFNNFANSLIKRGRDQEAIPVLLSALRQFEFGDRYRWWMNLGDAYRRTDQAESSIAAYQSGLEAADAEMGLNPRDGSVRSCLAYLAARLGDRRRAESEVAQALQLSGEKDTREIAAWTYDALGERDRALMILEKLSDEALADAARLPNLADLRKDARFIELLSSRHISAGEGK